MDYALGSGSVSVASLLLRLGAKINPREETVYLELAAAREGFVGVLVRLLERGLRSDVAGTLTVPLLRAIAAGNVGSVQLLLNYGADANHKVLGEGTLHHAARSGSPRIVQLLLKFEDIDCKEENSMGLTSGL